MPSVWQIVVLIMLANKCLASTRLGTWPDQVINPQKKNQFCDVFCNVSLGAAAPQTPPPDLLDFVVFCVMWLVACAICVADCGAYQTDKAMPGFHKTV